MKFKPKIIHQVVTTTENGKEVSKRETDIVLDRCQVCGRTENEVMRDGYLPESKHYNRLTVCNICGKTVCHKCLIEIPGVSTFFGQNLSLMNCEFPLAFCPGCAKTHKKTLDELRDLVEARDKFVKVLETDLSKISRVLLKKWENTPDKKK